MMPVAPAVGGAHIGERWFVPVLVDVDAVADRSSILVRIRENARHRTGSDVDHIIDGTAAVRESGNVAGEESEALLVRHWSRGNSSVQSKEVCDRTCIIRSAPGADRSRVHDQGKQVGSRRRRYGNVQDRRVQVCEQRIEEEVCELLVILRIRDAEQILRSSSDDQFVDQGVALAVHLPPLARAVNATAAAADGDALSRSGPVSANYGPLVGSRM